MTIPFNRTIKAIVIHHMGDGRPPSIPIAQRWNPYKSEQPEYDFGIEEDGTVRAGRPLNIQGAHCIADKPQYSKKGEQYWNQNSIGIGLAGDFTKYPMGSAQFNGLVSFVKKLMKQYGLTLDNVYPHGQVKYTDCPGCTYSKVPAMKKGIWSYDAFEKAVLYIAPVVVPAPVTPPPTPSIMYRVIIDNKQIMAVSSQDKAIEQLKKSIDAGQGIHGVVQRNDGVNVFEYTLPPIVVVPVVPNKDQLAVNLMQEAIKILKEGN